MSFVVASVLVVEDSLPTSLPVLHIAFVDASVVEVLLAVDALVLEVGVEGLLVRRCLLRDGQVAHRLQLGPVDHRCVVPSLALFRLVGETAEHVLGD